VYKELWKAGQKGLLYCMLNKMGFIFCLTSFSKRVMFMPLDFAIKLKLTGGICLSSPIKISCWQFFVSAGISSNSVNRFASSTMILVKVKA
jgi:hypothetical protein